VPPRSRAGPHGRLFQDPDEGPGYPGNHHHRPNIAGELWSTPWTLAVPAGAAAGVRGSAVDVFRAFRGQHWIGNSRNQADEDVIRLIASMAGFEPRLTHQADSLDLVEELILAGMGVGLMPADRPPRAGVALLPLADPDLCLRAYACTRRGRAAWPPLALVLHRLVR
jgi:DNA-binding transcriptional LysR family regulator